MSSAGTDTTTTPSGKPKSLKDKNSRRRGFLNRDDILSMSERAGEEPTSPVDYSIDFAPGSTIQLTWGKLTSEPTRAISKARRFQGYRYRKRKAAAKAEENFDTMPFENPAYPLLTNLPRELREVIFGYCLVSREAIILHSDWSEVHNNPRLDLSILRVCKRFNQEATCILYKRNIFHALVRDTILTRRFEQRIYPKYVPLFRDVVIECMEDNWTKTWIVSTAECIEDLAQNNVILSSLTLVIVPKIEKVTHRITGVTKNVVTFAEFFTKGSRVMRSLARLRCRVLNLVIKLTGGVKAVISLDVTHLECNYKGSQFATDEACKRSRIKKQKQTIKDLEGLRTAVYEITHNFQSAIDGGVCRLMGEGEEISDGAALKR